MNGRVQSLYHLHEKIQEEEEDVQVQRQHFQVQTSSSTTQEA